MCCESDVTSKPSSQESATPGDLASARSFEMHARKMLNDHKSLLNKVVTKPTLDTLVLNLNRENKMLKQEISRLNDRLTLIKDHLRTKC